MGSPQMNFFNVTLEREDKDVVAKFGDNKIVIPPSKLSKFADESVIGKEVIMQLHYGCRRDNNTDMFALLGPDTGYDCIDTHTPSAQLAALLGALSSAGRLPQTVLYSLNPQDNAAIDSVIGCFQNEEAVGRLQHV